MYGSLAAFKVIAMATVARVARNALCVDLWAMAAIYATGWCLWVPVSMNLRAKASQS